MKIERAIFVDGAFRGFYTLEECDTYTLYNPKREHCTQCNGESKFHWKKGPQHDHIALFFLTKEEKVALISKMIRLDINRHGKKFIPFERSDLECT